MDYPGEELLGGEVDSIRDRLVIYARRKSRNFVKSGFRAEI